MALAGGVAAGSLAGVLALGDGSAGGSADQLGASAAKAAARRGGRIAGATDHALGDTDHDGLAPSEPLSPPPSPPSPTIRPPAVPLAVRSPYLHAWLPGDTLPGTWAMRWTGQPTQLAGMARIDGATWVWAGRPEADMTMTQTGLSVTPTASTFTLEGGGVRLVAQFLNPIEPGNQQLQSAPLTLLTVSVAATDGRSHQVAVYADISGAWASGTTSDVISWQPATTPSAQCWTVGLVDQTVCQEHANMAAWGSVLFATARGDGLTYQSGADQAVRGRFAAAGALTSSSDPDFRAIDDDPPVVALAHDLGTVGPGGAACQFVLGNLRTPAVSYLGTPLQPAWAHFWDGSWMDMVDDFLADGPAARGRGAQLDSWITEAATKTGGPGYAELCALATAQTYAACELVVGPEGQIWAFLKEIGSGGATSTVDVIVAAATLWLYLDPGYLAMLLEPILAYVSTDWDAPWAPHDLGYVYPRAEGHYSNAAAATGEQMPVQETATMLVLADAYAGRAQPDTAVAFLAGYKQLWSDWATWLEGQLPSPPAQLTTDDYLGAIDHGVNLSLLGIVGLGAAGDIFNRLGDKANQAKWSATAKSLVPRWLRLSTSPAGHLSMTQGSTDGNWDTLYNAYIDRLIGTNLLPPTVAGAQAAWYGKQLQTYGLPFASTQPHWAQADWEAWTAAWLSDYPVGPKLIKKLVAYVNATPQRVPFSGFYWTTTGAQVDTPTIHYQARPVVGAMYALLTLA